MQRGRSSRDSSRDRVRSTRGTPLRSLASTRIPGEHWLRIERRELRCALQFDDREMLATAQVANGEFEASSTSSSNAGTRRSARLETDTGVPAVRRPASGVGQRGLSERNGVDDGGSHSPRPALGQGNPWVAAHGASDKESWGGRAEGRITCVRFSALLALIRVWTQTQVRRICDQITSQYALLIHWR